MTRELNPEEYAALFGPKPSSNGNGEVLDKPTDYGQPDTTQEQELTDEEVELLTPDYKSKFVEESWQRLDQIHMLRHIDKRVVENNPSPGVANWSEMGCYKTSTGLWLIDRAIQEAQVRGSMKEPLTPGARIPTDEHPSILIVTSKGGKGTFFEAIPEILSGWTLINIDTQKLSVMMNGQLIPLPQEYKYVPKKFDFPVICIAHYDIFSRSNKGEMLTDDEGNVVVIDGKIQFKPFLQADYITDRLWDIVWCDEFHRMKDRNTKWTVNIKKIKTRVAKHGSTGTGFINRPDEIWSLLNWLDKKQYGSYWKFRETFCEIDEYNGYVRGCKPEMKDAFRELVRDIGVRRTLDEVLPSIKRPIFKPELVELNRTQRKMYDQLQRELEAEDQKGTPLYAANVLTMLQRLRMICVGTPEVIEDYFDELLDRRVQKIKLVEPSSKIDKVMEILEGLQWDEEKKEPLVVFSCFKDPLELLKARLDKHNEATAGTDWEYKYIHLDVKDNDVTRYRKWHDDFPTMQYRVFMSTVQLGGESINLTPARHVVFLDRSWSPKDNAQAIGRVRRPGQEGQPVVIHINAEDTTDQYIESVVNIKQGWFNTIFGDK